MAYLRLHVYVHEHGETYGPSYRFGVTMFARPANRWYPEAEGSRSTLTKQIRCLMMASFG